MTSHHLRCLPLSSVEFQVSTVNDHGGSLLADSAQESLFLCHLKVWANYKEFLIVEFLSTYFQI